MRQTSSGPCLGLDKSSSVAIATLPPLIIPPTLPIPLPSSLFSFLISLLPSLLHFFVSTRRASTPAIMRYALSLLPALAAASPLLQVGTIHNGAAPVLSSTHAKEVPNSYMVVFKKHVKHEAAQSHHEWVQSIHTKNQDERMELRKRSQFPLTSEVFDGLKHTYNIVGGLMGYSGHFDDETLEAIRRHPDVSQPHPYLPFSLHRRFVLRFATQPRAGKSRSRALRALLREMAAPLELALSPQATPPSRHAIRRNRT